MKLRTNSPLRTKPISPFGRIINFSLFERKVTKEANEPAARPPRRASYRLGKFRPHLTHKPSVQMGCHRGITNSPNRGFFPTECVRQNRILITRTAPRAPYGHRRGLCVGTSVCTQNKFPTFGSEATVRLPPHIMPTRKAFRVQKVGGLRRRRWRRARANHLRTSSRLRIK